MPVKTHCLPRKLAYNSLMTVFISQYRKSVDRRGRITVPHDFRDSLGSEEFKGFVAFASHKNLAIECCGISKMEKLASRIDEGEVYPFLKDENEIITSIFADSYKISIDDAGRIVTPKELLEHAQISSEVLFVGAGKTFQMWNPIRFKEYRETRKVELLKNAST